MTEEKTNVMRLLEQKKIPYVPQRYPQVGQPVDAKTVAALLGADPASVFKTLVTRGLSGNCYVFLLPALGELDLKKAAKSVGEKSLDLIPLKDLTPLTGYVRGGCSPLGMKKQLTTVLHQSALARETMLVSAGKIGVQVALDPQALAQAAGASFADLVKDGGGV